MVSNASQPSITSNTPSSSKTSVPNPSSSSTSGVPSNPSVPNNPSTSPQPTPEAPLTFVTKLVTGLLKGVL